jgi:hypothetical protein
MPGMDEYRSTHMQAESKSKSMDVGELILNCLVVLALLAVGIVT